LNVLAEQSCHRCAGRWGRYCFKPHAAYGTEGREKTMAFSQQSAQAFL